MTRLFGVSACSFAAHMVRKQNSLDSAKLHPPAAQGILHFFYVDNGLTSGESISDVKKLQSELQQLFALEGFVLGK